MDVKGWYITPEAMDVGSLRLIDKVVLSMIQMFSKKEPCYVQTDVLANILWASTRRVQRIIKRLKDDGYVVKTNLGLYVDYNKLPQSNSSGMFIPKNIAYIDNLSFLDRIVLGFVTYFLRKSNNKVWATNGHIAKKLQISPSYVSQSISRLVEEGYVNRSFTQDNTYTNKTIRFLWMTKENWNNIKANQRKDINTDGKSTHQKGMELLKKAWNRQNLHHKGTKWYTQDERKENAVWSQFAESLMYTAQMKGFDFELTFDEQDKRRRKAEVINTHYIELIERLMYIYFYERENIFFEKPEEAYTPQEFCSYYCIYRLVNGYYREYYGNTIKEHGYQIMNYYMNNDVGEQLNPAEMDIIVSNPVKETV